MLITGMIVNVIDVFLFFYLYVQSIGYNYEGDTITVRNIDNGLLS